MYVCTYVCSYIYIHIAITRGRVIRVTRSPNEAISSCGFLRIKRRVISNFLFGDFARNDSIKVTKSAKFFLQIDFRRCVNTVVRMGEITRLVPGGSV